MTAGLYDYTVHLNAASWFHAVQHHWHQNVLTPMIRRSIEIEEAYLSLRHAAGPDWPAVEAELERRAAFIRTIPDLTYLGVLQLLRRDVLAGRFPTKTS